MNPKEQIVYDLINWLLSALYIPERNTKKLDSSRLEHFGISNSEPVNWGSLRCNDVKEFVDGSFLAIIDEAAPGACFTLCKFIEDHAKAYNYNVNVITEW